MEAIFLVLLVFSSLSWTGKAAISLEHHLADFDILRQLNQTSSDCQNQFASLDTLALAQMIDASAKIPSGLLAYNFFNLGNFHECYDIESDNLNGTIYGKYCLGTILIDSGSLQYIVQHQLKKSQLAAFQLSRTLANDQTLAGYHHGFCIPSGCTTLDMTILTQGVMLFMEDYCYSKATEPELDAGAITAICLLALFLSIVVISTAYDVTLFYQQQKPAHDIFVAFSAFTNGVKLLKSTKDPDQLLCLNGIKAITMTWIILGHEYLLAMLSPITNFGEITEIMKKTENMFLMGSSIAVDTFFTVGGLVTTYAFLKSANKGAKFNIVLFYIHRYIRLTPVLAVVVLFHATLLEHTGTGPLWGGIQASFITTCQEYWWAALLYLQNAFHDRDTCVPQTWYLSIDFQLYLLSPLVLLPLKKWPKYGLTIVGILILAGIAIPLGLTYHYKIGQFGSTNIDQMAMMWYYYKQTHTRFGPYVIGMLAGYFIYNLRKSRYSFLSNLGRTKRNVIVCAIWGALLAGLLACLYAPHDVLVAEVYNVTDNALLNAFQKQSWSLAVCGVVFMCVAGFGGPIDAFLSLPLFQFLTKLSYCMYLVHYGAIGIRYASADLNINFSHSHMMWTFWADYILTLVISLVLCLTFESPMITIERIVFRRKPKPSKSDQP